MPHERMYVTIFHDLQQILNKSLDFGSALGSTGPYFRQKFCKNVDIFKGPETLIELFTIMDNLFLPLFYPFHALLNTTLHEAHQLQASLLINIKLANQIIPHTH